MIRTEIWALIVNSVLLSVCLNSNWFSNSWFMENNLIERYMGINSSLSSHTLLEDFQISVLKFRASCLWQRGKFVLLRAFNTSLQHYLIYYAPPLISNPYHAINIEEVHPTWGHCLGLPASSWLFGLRLIWCKPLRGRDIIFEARD